MILEFGVRNFFCFKEGVSISFRLDSKCPAYISQGRSFSTVLGIKGANGSGKTQILKGLSFLGYFCTSSFDAKPDANTGIETFGYSKEPADLYIEFVVKDVTYLYELSLTSVEVKRETIYRNKGKKSVKIIERVGNELVTKTKEFERLHSIKLRKNVSIISSAHQYEFNELDGLYDYFNLFISNVAYGGLDEVPHDIYKLSTFFSQYSDSLTFTSNFISSCDTGISTIRIINLKNDGAKEDKFAPIFIHESENESIPVTIDTESSGTKALFRNLPKYKVVLDIGGVLILDEFDLHLHPHILPKLINLFADPSTNPKNAQMVFSTHDSTVLDLLGRYRTYLVNKEGNQSFAYRLDEIPGDILRNDRPISPVYSDGKIGGVPKL